MQIPPLDRVRSGRVVSAELYGVERRYNAGVRLDFGFAMVFLGLIALGSQQARCECDRPTPGPASSATPLDPARVGACCRALAHEAWNSDPPNVSVLRAAEACQTRVQAGEVQAALEGLERAGQPHCR